MCQSCIHFKEPIQSIQICFLIKLNSVSAILFTPYPIWLYPAYFNQSDSIPLAAIQRSLAHIHPRSCSMPTQPTLNLDPGSFLSRIELPSKWEWCIRAQGEASLRPVGMRGSPRRPYFTNNQPSPSPFRPPPGSPAAWALCSLLPGASLAFVVVQWASSQLRGWTPSSARYPVSNSIPGSRLSSSNHTRPKPCFPRV